MTQQVEAGDVTYLGGTWLSDNDSSLAELKKLKKDCRMGSLLLAQSFRALSCHIHESCDWRNCGSHGDDQEILTMEPEDLVPTDLVGVAFVLTETKATPQDVPRRDVQWLEQHNCSPLLYSPINSSKGEIRLLRVKNAFFRTDVVECDLVTTSLDKCIDFIALSYCWGSDQRSEVMLCNGTRCPITASLNAALKGFRESGHTAGHLLWADAVSINQYNESEKSEQIPLMGRIYSEANACFIHLGQAEPRVTQGLDLMLRLRILQIHRTYSPNRGSIPTNAYFTILPPRGHTSWTGYLRILDSPWFGRTWTLQEIALSKKALLGIGRYVVTWDCMEESMNFLGEHDVFIRAGLHSMHYRNFIKIQEIREVSQSPNHSSALITILAATRSFKVTDPRDKIYAILSLIGDVPDWLKSTIDYKLSPGEVFYRAALYMCEHPGPRDVLPHAGLQRQSGKWDMPSWVPDWSSDNWDREERPLLELTPGPFGAGGRDYMFKIESGKFTSLRLCHHKITHASKPFVITKSISDPTFSPSEASYAWLGSARECIESSGPLIYDDVEEALALTLLVDDLETGGNATKSPIAIQNPKMTFRAAMAEIDRTRRSKDPEEAFTGLFGAANRAAKMNPVQNFILQMAAAMRCRRFAITNHGYMCLVPACAEIGDAVAVLLGHPTPFTIRLKPGFEMSETGAKRVHAQLIGDTYMHGVMRCEMLLGALAQGRPPCEIVLI